MARTLPSAADAASAWSTGFGAAGAKWAKGIDSVQTAPGIAAAAAKDRYLQGVNASANKWANNTAAVTLQQWKTTAIAKGQGRLQSGAQAGLSKYQAAIGKVLEAERSVIASLPPRGDINANVERSRQFQLGMHAAFNGQ